MKKIMALFLGAITLAFTGCTPGCTPDESKIIKATESVAKATGAVIKLTKMDATTQTNIVVVLEEVRKAVPGDGKTCAETWTPIIQKTVADLVAKGKLNKTQADIVETSAVIAANGVDYILKKYSEIGKDVDLASKVVNTFVDTLKTSLDIEVTEKGDYDKEAYEYLLGVQRSLKK